jgi:DNA-binding SARP family transcriptional activator
VQPRIIALIAPAGFGKSTFTRQLISGAQAAICDAAGVADELDLARRLLPALAAERPDLMQTLTQRELMLGDDRTSVTERLNVALEAWRVPADGSIFVFENAEHIARNASAREFFAQLLSQCPSRRTLVVCSRENLRIHLTRFAAPHEILTLRAEDLALDKAELLTLFGREHGESPFFSRIVQASQGWPIAVFLLKRFANEGRIEELLERMGDVAFEELHDYLADQVLAELDQELVRALFACACMPHATVLDMRSAQIAEGAIRELTAFAKESPFLTRTAEGEFLVHPLLASLLLERRGEERNDTLHRTASAHERAGRFQRAAELHLLREDGAAAAHALGQHEVIRDHTPSMPYARILASLDRSLVQRYPRLWAVTTLLRMFCVETEQLLDEAESLWRTLSPQCPPIERYYILVFRVLLMSYIGLVEEATGILEQFTVAHLGEDEAQTAFQGYISYLRGLMLARTGHLTRAERDLTTALPLVTPMDVMASGTFLTLGADIARVRGEHTLARQFVERALERARASGLQNVVALVLAEASFGAWLCGEELLLSRYAFELDETVHASGVLGLAYVAAVFKGRTEEARDCDLLKWVACGRIIEAVNATEPAVAVRHARAAVTVAQQFAAPFIECLAYLTLAFCERAGFEDHMRAAMQQAERCESPGLVSEVYAIANHEPASGMLREFARRLESKHARHTPVLQVALAAGRVFVRGVEISLSDREFALLVALSIRRESVPRNRMAEMLWPDLDPYAARNALSVCLHRLRGHLGSDEIIVRVEDGYALGMQACVDLWEIQRLVTAVRNRPMLSPSETKMLSEAFEKLRARRPERMLQWEWFIGTDRLLNEARLEIGGRLAKDALAQADWQRALELSEAMIQCDPCDEAARHIAISAHLALGDRGSALRQYRRYREVLLEELQLEPSLELKHLVGLH